MEKMNGGFASEPKDLVIKLFGKTIPVPGSHLPSTSDDKSDDLSSNITETGAKDSSFEKSKNHDQPYIDKGVKEESSLVTDDGDRAQANIKMKVYEEKVLKKPDKVLSCPRCNSFDTKFCYFNNYNVNQPRHFCRQCQRYWTAGGAMRNVPIGAGKRKHKYFASQYGHVTVPLSTLQANLNIVSRDGKLLKFNSESGICQSIETVENEMADPVSLQNFPVPPVFPQNQVHSLVSKAEARWPYKVNRNPIKWGKKKVVSGPSPPDISLQFVPALLWGCVPATRHMPIGVSDGGLSQSSCASNSCLDNNSPNLGKRQKWGLLDDSLLLNEKESESSSGILRP